MKTAEMEMAAGSAAAAAWAAAAKVVVAVTARGSAAAAGVVVKGAEVGVMATAGSTAEEAAEMPETVGGLVRG